MSTIKVEPFFFSEEDSDIQIIPEALPGASETQEEKPVVEEDKEIPEASAIEDEEEEITPDDNDAPDPLNLFNKQKKETKEESVKEEKLTSDKVDYKAFTDFLIETEVWKDFEGKDTIDYNEETFQALWKAQAENTAKQFLNEQRSEFGDTANQLIEYLKDGGTINDFVSNYTQQLDIASIDTSEEYGQEKVIKEYYESLNWKPEKIRKQIERLKDSGAEELKEEADDCKSKLVEAIESERQEMLQEQEAISKDRKLKAETFNKSVREFIYKDDTIVDREKKELDKFLFEHKYEDKESGRKYSEFAVKFNEITQNPAKYQKLLKFVKNIDSFEDKKVTEKKTTEKVFNFLKEGSNPLAGAQGEQPVKQKQSTPPGFKFK